LGLDDNWQVPAEKDKKIIAIRPVIIDSLEIVDDFRKRFKIIELLRKKNILNGEMKKRNMSLN
jgi:hypothetical protein